ncbi:hypothetical protein N2152v2_008593 [Parachlorella kessleri]
MPAGRLDHARPAGYHDLAPVGVGASVPLEGGDVEAEVSPEFRELCQQQVDLLLSSLQTSLAAGVPMPTSSSSSSDGSNGRGCRLAAAGGQNGARPNRPSQESRQAGACQECRWGLEGATGVCAALASLVTGTTLRCAVYCRSAQSIRSGQLRLHLLARSRCGGGCGGLDATAGAGGGLAEDPSSLLLGQGPYSLEDEEQWLVEQSIIVLPDSGGLVLPLTYHSFLLGLLVVERGSPAAESEVHPGRPLLQPSTCTLLGPAEFQLLKQGASVLALACAMDLRATLERAGNISKQRHVRGLVQEARKPLSTLRTLGAMLAPRLQHGDPDRDMAEGIMAQGDRLAELVSQLQTALHPPPVPTIAPRLPLDGIARPPPNRPAHVTGPSGERPLLQGPPGSSRSGKGCIQGDGRVGVLAGSYARPQPLYPALPSSSIGYDSSGRTIDLGEGDWASSTSGSGNGIVSSPLPGGAAGPTDQRDTTGMVSAAAAAAASVVRGCVNALPHGVNGWVATAGEMAGQEETLVPLPAAEACAELGMAAAASAAAGAAAATGTAAGTAPARWRAEDGSHADLYNVLMPLLATAANFAALNGITLLMVPPSQQQPAGDTWGPAGGEPASLPSMLTGTALQQEARNSLSQGSGGSDGIGIGSKAGVGQQGLPSAVVTVDSRSLKRMLSQLFDGFLACAVRGDCIEVAVVPSQWDGRAGVAVTLCCLQHLTHAQQAQQAGMGSSVQQHQQQFSVPSSSAAVAAGPGSRGQNLWGDRSLGSGMDISFGAAGPSVCQPLLQQPEFAFLTSSARRAGGWFHVASSSQPLVVEDARRVRHVNCSSLTAVLWLPLMEPS